MYWEEAMRSSPYAQFKGKDDPEGYLEELMSCAQAALDDKLSWGAFDKQGNMVLSTIVHDYMTEIKYPPKKSLLFEAAGAIEDDCIA